MTDNHQEENARGLEAVGAGVVLVERDWDWIPLSLGVEELMGDADKRQALAAAAKSQARLDAAALAADEVERLLPGAN